MKYGIEGREYEFDTKLTVEEAMLIHDKAHLGLNEFDSELRKGNPYATAALLLICKKRAGEAVRWQDLLQVDLLTFRVIPDEPAADEAPGEADEKPVEKAPDPTSTPGKTRRRATSGT